MDCFRLGGDSDSIFYQCYIFIRIALSQIFGPGEVEENSKFQGRRNYVEVGGTSCDVGFFIRDNWSGKGSVKKFTCSLIGGTYPFSYASGASILS